MVRYLQISSHYPTLHAQRQPWLTVKRSAITFSQNTFGQNLSCQQIIPSWLACSRWWKQVVGRGKPLNLLRHCNKNLSDRLNGFRNCGRSSQDRAEDLTLKRWSLYSTRCSTWVENSPVTMLVPGNTKNPANSIMSAPQICIIYMLCDIGTLISNYIYNFTLHLQLHVVFPMYYKCNNCKILHSTGAHQLWCNQDRDGETDWLKQLNMIHYRCFECPVGPKTKMKGSIILHKA